MSQYKITAHYIIFSPMASPAQNLVPARRPNWLSTGWEKKMPAVFLRSADGGKRFWEYFTAHIRNRNTRTAYFTAVSQFSDWCEQKKLTWNACSPSTSPLISR